MNTIDAIIIYGAAFAVFPICALYNMRTEKRGAFNDSIVSRRESEVLRGIAAIFVVLSHYISNFSVCGFDMGAASIYDWFGGMGVCMFFFLSGYGLMCSAKKRPPTLVSTVKRVLSVLIPLLLVKLVFWFAYYGGGGWWSCVLFITGLDGSVWFLSVIMLIYMMVYIAFRFFCKHTLISMLVMLVAMSAAFLLLGFPGRWYNSPLIFLPGMCFAAYRERITIFLKRRYILKLFACGALFAALCGAYVLFKKVWLLSDMLKLASGLMLNAVIITIMLKVRLRSGIMAFFGKASLYVYIVHVNVWAIVYYAFPTQPGLVFALCVSPSLALSAVCYFVDKGIRKFYEKSREKALK